MANPATKRAKLWHVGVAVVAGVLGWEWLRGKKGVPKPGGSKNSVGSVY